MVRPDDISEEIDMTENTNVARVERQEIDHAPEPQQSGGGILSVIERIASNPEIDVERMQALLQMRADEEDRIRRMDREDRADAAKRAWLRDFAKVQAKVGPIVRGRNNTHTKSKYADLADIERIVNPILTEHGFSTTCEAVAGAPEHHIRMRLTIGHAEGHEKAYEDDFPIDDKGSQGSTNKTPIQAKGSTQSYGRRYLKASAMDLAFMDDNDGNAPQGQTPTINADQFREIKDLIDKAGGFEAEKFICERSGVENINELPLQDFTLVKSVLQQKAKKLAEEAPDA